MGRKMTKDERLKKMLEKYTVEVCVLRERGTYEGSCSVFEMPYGHPEQAVYHLTEEEWAPVRHSLAQNALRCASDVLFRKD